MTNQTEPVYHACADCMKERSNQTVTGLRAMILTESKDEYDLITAMALYCRAEHEVLEIHRSESHEPDFANFVFLVVDDAEITTPVYIRISNILTRIKSQKLAVEMARKRTVGWGLTK